MHHAAAAQLRECLRLAEALGDEPRRAALCAHLGRFLTYCGEIDEAGGHLEEAERVATRLDLPRVLLASRAACGRWLADSGKSDEKAVRTLGDVAREIRALDEGPLYARIDLAQPGAAPDVVRGRHPSLCRVLLDLNRAARFAGDADVMNQTLDELNELTARVFPGYRPHYYLSGAECLIQHGDAEERETVAELLRAARDAGELSQNPWVAQEADRLEAINAGP